MLDFKVKVPFFDASQLYKSDKAALDEAIQKVLTGGAYINGAEVETFANNLANYLNINYVTPCGNGTDALCLALMALGLNKGDEVIVPTFNFIAAAEAVSFLGLVPVFADVSRQDFNITAENIAEKINPKTKAIIVVHLFGAAADMEPIIELANRHQIFVIEDVAQALGSEYNGEKLGTFGTIGCTSFFPTKNLACFGDGGAVFTNNSLLGNKLKMLANHGQRKKYDHQYVGINSRLDTLQAAILCHQLTKLDLDIERRITLAQRYTAGLESLNMIIPKKREYTKHSFNQYCVLLQTSEERDKLEAYLHHQGISTMIYYSQPNHLQEAFSSLGYEVGDFPIAEDICGRVLALPISNITAEQQDHIINHIKSFFASV